MELYIIRIKSKPSKTNGPKPSQYYRTISINKSKEDLTVYYSSIFGSRLQSIKEVNEKEFFSHIKGNEEFFIDTDNTHKSLKAVKEMYTSMKKLGNINKFRKFFKDK